MLVNTTTDVVRIMGAWARRADAGLARSAAINAGRSMHADRNRELDDVRTMRDLARIPAVTAVEPERRRASH